MNVRWRQKFAWSHSRQKCFAGCRKQYFFNYIAPWGPKSELTETLWKLKKLTSLIFFKGNLVHDVIAAQISSEKIGIGMSRERALEMADQLVADLLKKRSLKRVFVEVANGGKVSPEDLETIRLEARLQIENFFDKVWPLYQEMRIVTVEDFARIGIEEIPVTVKLDLGLETFDGMSCIVDWKSGKVRPEEIDNSAQVTTYILARSILTNTPPDYIFANLVYLKTGEVFTGERTAEQIKEIREEILFGAREMLAVKSEDDFPASPKEWRCRGCQFAIVCEEGKQHVEAK